MALKVTTSYIPHLPTVNTADPVLNQWSRDLINRVTDQFTTIAQRLNKAFLSDSSEALTVYTFATLPTPPKQGMVAVINNSNTAVFNAVAAGGGANVVKVLYNGTNWVVA